MAYNKYAGPCHYCSNRVGAKAGELLGKIDGRWAIAHTACNHYQEPRVTSTYFPTSGETVYQNARGRCIDAPCCDCCS